MFQSCIKSQDSAVEHWLRFSVIFQSHVLADFVRVCVRSCVRPCACVQVVRAVWMGAADIGFVRTLQIDAMAELKTLLNGTDFTTRTKFKYIHIVNAAVQEGGGVVKYKGGGSEEGGGQQDVHKDSFPHERSTAEYPEWVFSALPSVDWRLQVAKFVY